MGLIHSFSNPFLGPQLILIRVARVSASEKKQKWTQACNIGQRLAKLSHTWPNRFEVSCSMPQKCARGENQTHYLAIKESEALPTELSGNPNVLLEIFTPDAKSNYKLLRHTNSQLLFTHWSY